MKDSNATFNSSVLRNSNEHVETNEVSSQEGYDPLHSTEIKQVPLGIQEDLNINKDFKCDKSMGAMSFGEKARPLDGISEVSFDPIERDKKYSKTVMEDFGRSGHGSIISIRDIQEVKDKVPASPSSELKDNHY